MTTKTKTLEHGESIVHDSTNPHKIIGAKNVISEQSFTVPDKGYLVTNPANHHALDVCKGEWVIGFVQTATVTGEVRRIAD